MTETGATERTKLQDTREAAGLSQTQLANAAGLHPADISRIERRRALPAPFQRSKLATALGRSEDDLFSDFPDRIPLQRNN